jgi:hypothetical protein
MFSFRIFQALLLYSLETYCFSFGFIRKFLYDRKIYKLILINLPSMVNNFIYR